MKDRKVLLVGTYPIKNPQHGGQKRLSAIYAMYKEVFSDVRYVSVFHKNVYKDYTKNDISLGLETTLLANSNPLTGDIISGEAVYKDAAVKKKITQQLLDFRPDILHIEQPYMYLGLKPLLKDLGLKPKIVFGSQNIEGPMKRDILEGYNAPEDYVEETVALIDKLEKELSRDSDLTTACTLEDVSKHKAMGAENLVLSMNGIAPINPKDSDINYWKKVKQSLQIKDIVIFVASAHPPSITGFLEMVGKGVGFLTLDQKIFMAGSICDHFDRNIKSENIDIYDATFWLRVYSCGRLSEDRLTALLTVADVILLPITEGGGSNLKTAEAIVANKKIVTTSHALRSFEWLKEFPNVWVADDKDGFQEAIKNAVSAKFVPRTQEQEAKARSVLWDSRLKDLKSKVVEL